MSNLYEVYVCGYCVMDAIAYTDWMESVDSSFRLIYTYRMYFGLDVTIHHLLGFAPLMLFEMYIMFSSSLSLSSFVPQNRLGWNSWETRSIILSVVSVCKMPSMIYIKYWWFWQFHMWCVCMQYKKTQRRMHEYTRIKTSCNLWAHCFGMFRFLKYTLWIVNSFYIYSPCSLNCSIPLCNNFP